MSNYDIGKMKKAVSKDSKARKCPSKNVIESEITVVSDTLAKNCTLNENVRDNNELKNGFVNGVISDSMSVNKSNRKSRRNRKSNNLNARERIDSEMTNCKPEDNCIAKSPTQAEDQSKKNLDEHSVSQSDNIVNSVDKKLIDSKSKKCKSESLDSNDNISNVCCDSTISLEESQLTTTLQAGQEDLIAPVAVINDKAASKDEDFLNNINDEFVLDLEKSLKNVQLGNSQESSDTAAPKEEPVVAAPRPKIDFVQYESELQMPMIMKIIQKDLSEPYSIYTYRYFIHNWPKLCFLAMCENECVGAIVCKLDLHRKVIKRGYIAMLAVDQKYRNLRIGSNLVQMAINEMIVGDADEVVLETEVTNKPALQLYEKLGFVRDKRLFRYYLNGVDALRLKLWLR